ncbi:helix-turn-helix domain-containing protein [Flectobacillus major]|uniref:helix-turn-helix domain-containing protein n=1 Tax=Flectobacillus major TaxID=103 RepID=UPI000409B14D|nr:helix-turn-helix domain-containing protein [Flectobacillus major]
MSITLQVIAIVISFFWGLKSILSPSVIHNKIFGILFLIWGWYLTMNLLIWSGLTDIASVTPLFLVGRPVYILSPYLVYVYIASISGKIQGKVFTFPQSIINLLPCVLVGLDLVKYYSLPLMAKQQILTTIHLLPQRILIEKFGYIPFIYEPYLASSLSIIYFTKIWMILSKQNADFNPKPSFLYDWSRAFVYSILALVIGEALFFFIGNDLLKTNIKTPFFDKALEMHAVYTILLLVSWLLFWYKNRDVFSLEQEAILPILPIKKTKSNDENLIANDVDINTIRLFLETQKPYLKPKYTLAELALSTGYQPYEISIAINTLANSNFNDFINQYRIETIKERLLAKEYENMTIEGIAFESGFKNKTTFLSAFKKFTGMTPKEYIKLTRLPNN